MLYYPGNESGGEKMRDVTQLWRQIRVIRLGDESWQDGVEEKK